jgi:hypothetical protein
MTVFSFYIFDRHSACTSSIHRNQKPNINPAECIYSKRWSQSLKQAQRQSGTGSTISNNTDIIPGVNPKALSNEDDAKLIFGSIFSLRRMTRQLGGEDDRCIPHTLNPPPYSSSLYHLVPPHTTLSQPHTLTTPLKVSSPTAQQNTNSIISKQPHS